MTDDNLDVSFCNTVEGMHAKAKELGIAAYNLGCSCNECNLAFDTVTYKAMVDKVNKSTDADIAKCGQPDLPSQLHKEIWNRAIEKAVEVCNKYESYGAAYEIRTLKV